MWISVLVKAGLGGPGLLQRWFTTPPRSECGSQSWSKQVLADLGFYSSGLRLSSLLGVYSQSWPKQVLTDLGVYSAGLRHLSLARSVLSVLAKAGFGGPGLLQCWFTTSFLARCMISVLAKAGLGGLGILPTPSTGLRHLFFKGKGAGKRGLECDPQTLYGIILINIVIHCLWCDLRFGQSWSWRTLGSTKTKQWFMTSFLQGERVP